MYIFELMKPGTSIVDISDISQRNDAEALLELITSCVQDAAICLSLFEDARQHHRVPESRALWAATRDHERERERQIEETLEQQLPADLDPSAFNRARRGISDQARVEAKRERWQAGEIPQSYQHRLAFIHAKSCLYAFDTIEKSLALLGGIPGIPGDVRAASSDFSAAFPDLKRVRDSAHHAEDRVQGKRRRARLDLQPAALGTVNVSNVGVLILDVLNGNRFGGTLEDGTYGEVEISVASVAAAQRIVQAVLDCFQWIGPESHLPY